jgi:hypothetical protein
MPCDWQPTTVMNPSVGIPFTDISAWHYVAELAEAGHHIDRITLEHPRGETAYVMSVRLEANAPDLYIKVQLRRGRIWGRSFHYSTL